MFAPCSDDVWHALYLYISGKLKEKRQTGVSMFVLLYVSLQSTAFGVQSTAFCRSAYRMCRFSRFKRWGLWTVHACFNFPIGLMFALFLALKSWVQYMTPSVLKPSPDGFNPKAWENLTERNPPRMIFQCLSVLLRISPYSSKFH